MNNETKKILSESEELSSMLKSRGWAVAKRMLLDRMADMGSLLNLEERDPVRLFQLVGAKQEAIKMVIEWINSLDNSVSWAEEYKKGIKDNIEKMVITSEEV
jgi:hypothetical protein